MKAAVLIAMALMLAANMFFVSAEVDDKISLGVNLNTNLNASMMGPSSNQYMLVHMSDGQERKVTILPMQASAMVMSEFNSSCNDGMCDVDMMEENTDNGWRVMYVVHSDKNVELFGFMKMSMPLEVAVDAQSGQIIRVEKPWWAVLSSNSSITGNVAAKISDYENRNDKSDSDNNKSDAANEEESTQDSGTITVNVAANSSVKSNSGQVIYTKNSYKAIGRDGMDTDSSSSSSAGNNDANQPWQCPYLTE